MKSKVPKQKEPLTHQAHYTSGGIDTIDYLKAKFSPEEFRGYCRGAALKYLSRLGLKGSIIEDATKAKVYLEFLIEAEKENPKRLMK